jgi:hypothetical protein
LDHTVMDQPYTCKSLDEADRDLRANGWALLSEELINNRPFSAVEYFGRCIPQYNGALTWEVTPKPGFEAVPYSQSSNGIGAHTEAPVLLCPPKYLALHCKRQARCGGGYTVLADGLDFCSRYVGMERSSSQELEFVATPTPGSAGRFVRKAPMLDVTQREPVFRFSYNQIRYGDVNPSEDKVVSANSAANCSPEMLRLTELVQHYYDDHAVALLVPDNAMLIWNNHRMMHSRTQFRDQARHLTRYWMA